MMRFGLVAIALFLMLTRSALPEASVGEFRKNGQEAYLLGVENGLSWANATLQAKGQNVLYCQPKAMAITPDSAGGYRR